MQNVMCSSTWRHGQGLYTTLERNIGSRSGQGMVRGDGAGGGRIGKSIMTSITRWPGVVMLAKLNTGRA